MTTFEIMRVDGTTETLVTKAKATGAPDADKGAAAELKAKLTELTELLTGEGVVMDAVSMADWLDWADKNIDFQTDFRAGKTNKATGQNGPLALAKSASPAHGLGAHLLARVRRA